MVWLGKRSYSLYLWHIPILVALGAFNGRANLATTLAAVTLSLIAAELSYRYVEQPFRRAPAPNLV